MTLLYNYPDSPHSQGGMKFATQISPLLNFNVKEPISEKNRLTGLIP